MSDDTPRSDARDIAVVGLSAAYAQSPDVHAFWQLLLEGRHAFGPVPADRWPAAAFHDENARNVDKSYAPSGAFMDDVRSFPAIALGVPPRRVEVMDPQQRLALELAWRALESAGLRPEEMPRKTGVFMGVTATEYRTLLVSRLVAQMMAVGHFGTPPEDLQSLVAAVERVVPPRPLSATGLLANMVAGAVGQELHLRGPAYTVDSACSSSLVAVHNAMTHLRAGTLDAALVGGVYLSLTPEHYIAFSRIGAMSRQGVCRPFDAEADGFVQGDGGAVLVLMRLEDARKQGLRVDAVLHGAAVNNDGGGDGPMAPRVEGQTEVITDAWEDAGQDPRRLGYLETHGTGTLVGDGIELDGFVTALQGRLDEVALGSSKANVGHTMSAAGVTGLLRALLALRHRMIPPMANFRTPKSELKLDERPVVIPTAPRAWDGEHRLAAVSSFGFGGTNAHVVLGDGRPHTPEPVVDVPELFVLSSWSLEALRAEAASLHAFVEADGSLHASAIARALVSRRAQPVRAAFVACGREELLSELKALATQSESSAVMGETEEEPRLAWIFPGQGAQRVGMLAGLRDRFPVVARTLKEADRALESVLETPLLELLYPQEDLDAQAALARLTRTEHCQPALVAVGAALSNLLESIGLRPSVVAGHSVGEFSAGYAAGLLSLQAAMQWSHARGRRMSSVEGDPGAMAAVVASPDEVTPLLREGAVLANINHPKQVVVSGATQAVHDTATAAEAAGLRVVLLNVSHAFHSPIFNGVDFQEDLGALSFDEASLPIVSCIDDCTYQDGDTALSIYARHARSPVEFLRALRRCRDVEGATHFLQVGAGGPLASLVRATFGHGEDAPKVFTLATENDQDGGVSLLRTLGQLWVEGCALDLRPLCATTAPASLPPAKLPREVYWGVKDGPQAPLDLRLSDGRKFDTEAGARSPVPTPASLQQEGTEDARVATPNESVAPKVHVAEAGLEVQAPPVAAPPQTTPQPAAPVAVSSPARAERPISERPDMTGTSDPALEALVLDAVATASAYPRSALKTSMKLLEDLGFDSIMVADLAEAIERSVPGFAGFPRELFVNSPTIAQVIAFVADASRKGPGETPKAADDDAPLTAWVPVWRPATLQGMEQVRDLIQVRVLLVGEGGPLRDALSSALRAAGAQLLVRVPSKASDSEAVDLIVHVVEDAAHPTWNAVVTGEAPTPDLPGLLLDHLALRARRGERPDVLLVGRSDDLWIEGAAGALRALSEEWTSSRLATLRFEPALPPEERADAVVADWCSPDRSRDLLVGVGGRAVRGFSIRDAVPGEEVPVGPNDRVLISGGTRGLGAQIGRELVALGAEVVLVGRSEPDDATRAWIAGAQGQACSVKADVTDAESLRQALSDQGPFSVFVHAAGLLADGPLEGVDPEEGARARRVKVLGWIEAIRFCGDSLRLAYGLGSWAGRFGNRHQVHYAAANAQLAALAEASTLRLRMTVGEFGPWSDSSMVASIPAAIQRAMREQGVDFVGPKAGLQAVLEDLRGGEGASLWGRSVVETTRRIRAVETLDVETSPYLLDHAIEGVPVFPMASAADGLAWCAVGERVPYVLEDLVIYRGVTASEPQRMLWQVEGEEATLRVGLEEALAYRARVRTPSDLPSAEPMPEGGTPPELPLDVFYRDITFHGPRLQGIERIDAVGEDWVVGQVRTGRPRDWMPGSARSAWTLDPLMFDSAMQLAAWVAWQRYRRAGVPVAMRRWTQVLPVRAESLTAAVRMASMDGNRFEAAIEFLDASGQLVAKAEGVVGELREVAAVAPEADGVQPPSSREASDAPLVDQEATAEPSRDEPENLSFEVKPAWVDVAVWPEIEELDMRLQMADQFGLKNPYFDVHDGTARGTTHIDGREFINFSSYNYLGLSGDSRVLSDVHEAVDRYGTSCSASRVASGERPFHRELEAELARAHGCEDAIVFTAGHATNVTTIGHLFGKHDLILHDELIHDSALQGIRLAGSARRGFRHEDPDHLEEQLRQLRPHYQRVLIVIEGVYSMDGDIAQLPAFVRLREKYGCLLMVDEAHSFGTLGANGRGIQEHFGVRGDVGDLWMGTLSKSLASVGGWIAGRAPLIRYLRYTAPGFVYSAGLPAASAVAALSSLRLMLEEPWRVERLQANSRLFCDALRREGIDTGPAMGESPVVPVVTGDSVQALMLSDRLLGVGVNAKPIVYPAVANDAARLRCFLSSTHTEDQLLKAASTFATELKAVRKELGVES